jgi:cytochrome c oxidase assembly factor CtaG
MYFQTPPDCFFVYSFRIKEALEETRSSAEVSKWEAKRRDFLWALGFALTFFAVGTGLLANGQGATFWGLVTLILFIVFVVVAVALCLDFGNYFSGGA